MATYYDKDDIAKNVKILKNDAICLSCGNVNAVSHGMKFDRQWQLYVANDNTALSVTYPCPCGYVGLYSMAI